MKPRISRRLEFLILLGAIMAAAFGFFPGGSSVEPSIEPPESEILETMMIRCEVKKRLASEVAAGQRTLLEAAALFDALDRLPAAPVLPKPIDAGVSGSERACCQVINWVEAHFGSSDGSVTIARLQTALQLASAQPGGLRLPDANSGESIERLLAGAREQLPRIKEGKR